MRFSLQTIQLRGAAQTLLALSLLLTSINCAVVEGVSDVTWEVAKLTGKAAGHAVKGAVHIATGKQRVRLKRIGNGLFAEATINRKTKAMLLVDTGATNVMLSQRIAVKLGLDLRGAKKAQAKLASGKVIPARVVFLKELRVGKARIENIPAIILEQENGEIYDGLLGMSFLDQFIFQIDAKNGELILQKRAPSH